jgi:hypothetical protein
MPKYITTKYIRTVVVKIMYNMRLFESVSKKAEAKMTIKKYIVTNTIKTIVKGTSARPAGPNMRLIIVPALGDLAVPCLCAPFFDI